MEHVYSAIDTAIQENRNFVVYRLPGENKLRFVAAPEDAIQTLFDFEELNGREGYVIAPFGITNHTPIVFLEAEETSWEYPEESPFGTETEETPVKASISPRYKKRFHQFLEPLSDGYLDKVVFSRQLKLMRPETFSPAEAFLKACYKYTQSYVYLFHTPITGTWMGSTPELLLAGENGDWQTVALAGTQPLVNGQMPLVWSEKNFEEQRMVSDYIYNQLTAVGIEPTEKGPYAIKAGEVSHLLTDFRFQLPDVEYIGDLLKLLHPTPAVCGLPKEEAFWFIRDFEGYDREYYSGFLGWLRPDGKTELYVNLRCMQVAPRLLTLFAGSGLLPLATADEEWQETEDKMQTMKTLI